MANLFKRTHLKTWTAHSHRIDAKTIKITLSSDRELSYADVLSLWSENSAFRTFFTGAVNETAFDAYFWETPPFTISTLNRRFEFVLVESGSLARLSADPMPFREHFLSNPSAKVLTFPNLGRDAVLVVPAPVADDACYAHLARFLKGAPPAQIDSFWEAVGNAMRKRVSTSPVWLSTAGMGVSWLHLRLDSRPKYYRHQPYTKYP